MTGATAMQVLYSRVSTDRQQTEGHSLDAQHTLMQHHADYKGWTDIEFIAETGTGRTLNRPGLQRALATLGEGDILCVARLDRVSRSTVGLGHILERAKSSGWHLIALDYGLSTDTANGRLMASILMSVAQWEVETLSDRIKLGIRAARDKGLPTGGTPSPLPDSTRDTILSLRASGMTLAQVASRLTADRVPTAAGRPTWSSQQIHRVTTRAARAAQTA